MNERWLNSGYILKTEPTGFIGFGYEVCEKKSHKHSKDFGFLKRENGFASY